ncbi:MAG: hypothetical protein WBX49_01330 [Candidatus Deferrimicrobiaceae bacterium]
MKGIRAVMWFRVFLPTFLFLACMGHPAAAAEGNTKGALDGKVFVVETGRKGKQTSGKDTILFRDGRFLSTIREKWDGFGPETYTAAANGDAVTFAADSVSRTRGTMHWEGTVRGDRIDARYVWTDAPRWYRSRPAPAEYWARGKDVNTSAGPFGGGPGGPRPLDGKTFFVRTGEKGKKADHDDYLIFRNGMFVSSGCVEQNFGTSIYSTENDGGGIRFRAQTESPTHGAMIWEGTVRGDVVDATARWIHKRWYWTIDRKYWFQGQLVE